MHTNVLRLISIGIIIAILTMSVVPVMASTAVDKMADHCDSNPSHGNTSTPICCLMADCPIFHCILSSSVDDRAMLITRPVLNNNIPIASNTGISSESHLCYEGPSSSDLLREFPCPLVTEYHCRNCLDSEEPYSL